MHLRERIVAALEAQAVELRLVGQQQAYRYPIIARSFDTYYAAAFSLAATQTARHLT
jgi:hypothetical protein